MPNETRVHDLWVSFAKDVLPRDCLPIQRREMRRAFYGGVGAMLLLVKSAADLTDEEGFAIIDSCQRELLAFVALAGRDQDE